MCRFPDDEGEVIGPTATKSMPTRRNGTRIIGIFIIGAFPTRSLGVVLWQASQDFTNLAKSAPIPGHQNWLNNRSKVLDTPNWPTITDSLDNPIGALRKLSGTKNCFHSSRPFINAIKQSMIHTKAHLSTLTRRNNFTCLCMVEQTR